MAERRLPSPVPRSKREARAFYSRLAAVYDWVEGWWERRPRELGVQALAVGAGEVVLEVGPGTGHALAALAARVGPRGRVYGLDVAEGMLRAARRRVARAGLLARVGLVQGDGATLPFRTGVVDAVFMSFTLELFDTPELPRVLAECRRVLRPGGRLGLVALRLPERPGLPVRLYEWGHRRFPRLLDCRPIPVRRLLEEAGFPRVCLEGVSLGGLPVAVAVATSP